MQKIKGFKIVGTEAEHRKRRDSGQYCFSKSDAHEPIKGLRGLSVLLDLFPALNKNKF